MVKKRVIFGRCVIRGHMDPRGHKVRAMEAEKEAANARTFLGHSRYGRVLVIFKTPPVRGIKNTEKIASSYDAMHYRPEADEKRIGS